MLVSLGFDVPVVVICEVPSHDWVVVKETDVDRILWCPAQLGGVWHWMQTRMRVIARISLIKLDFIVGYL